MERQPPWTISKRYKAQALAAFLGCIAVIGFGAKYVIFAILVLGTCFGGQ